MEDHSKHYLISGRVQGVGFRMYVQRQARQLKLKGWVRNLSDGRVEACAQGSATALEELAILIKQGPPHARVESVVVGEMSRATDEKEFVVKGDGEEPWSGEF